MTMIDPDLRSKRAVNAKPSTEIKLPVPRSLIASATQIKATDSLWDTFRFTDTTWQAECWRFFHTTPELHYATDYIGSACSRVRIFITELDALGRPQREVDDDDEIMAIADTLFGGPGQKAEALKAIGANLTIAGECYIVGKARRASDPDAWFVASTTELKRRVGQIAVDFGYGPEQILAGTDLVIRLWTPDPQRMRYADSPTRACMNVLLELEQLEKYEHSQIDSRLSGAGIYPIPAEMSAGTTDANVQSAADDVFQITAEAARASRTQQGSAASVVPIFIEVPGEWLKDLKDKPIRFDSELSDKLGEYKGSAIRRLATGLNVPLEVIMGMGDTNHLSTWQIEESFVKIQVEPIMNRICDGLTKAYLRPLLKAMGKDPDRFMLSYDTAPLTVRPNRLQDTVNLFTLGIASAEAVLVAGDYNPSITAPTQAEETKRFIKELMLRDPTLFQIPEMREEIGIHIEVTAPMPELGAGGDVNAPGPAAPPVPARSTSESGVPTPSGRPGTTGPNTGTPILASAEVLPGPTPYLSAANVVCRRAFELAGGKMLSRANRGQFPEVPKHLLHTKIRVPLDQVDDLINFTGIEEDFAGQEVDLLQTERILREYCGVLLASNTAHHITLLATKLAKEGLI